MKNDRSERKYSPRQLLGFLLAMVLTDKKCQEVYSQDDSYFGQLMTEARDREQEVDG